MRKNKDLSACEMTAMKCIWDMGVATAGGIAGRLDWEYGLRYDEASVRPFLKKLLQTGFIYSYRETDVYYVPAIREKEFQREQQEKVLKFWRSGRMNRFISGL